MLGEGHELGLHCEEFEGGLGEFVEVDDLEGDLGVLAGGGAMVGRCIDSRGRSKADGRTKGIVAGVATVDGDGDEECMWKCGWWKCGNVETKKVDMWECGNVEMWTHILYARVHPKLVIDCTDPRVVCWRSGRGGHGG